MSQVVIAGDVSGTVTLQAPSVAGTTVLTLPTTSGTLSVGSAALTLISTQTASNSATLSWTGLSGYNQYLLVWNDLTNVTANTYLGVKIGTGSGPTYLTSGYAGGSYGWGGSVVGGQAAPSSYWWLSQVLNGSTPANYPSSGFAIFNNMTNGYRTAYNYLSSAFYSTTGVENDAGGGFNSNTSPVTAIQIYQNSGNIGTGSASLYGISS